MMRGQRFSPWVPAPTPPPAVNNGPASRYREYVVEHMSFETRILFFFAQRFLFAVAISASRSAFL